VVEGAGLKDYYKIVFAIRPLPLNYSIGFSFADANIAANIYI